MQKTVSPALGLLSPRERDCLRLLLKGLHTPQAAASLGISISTLNKHLTSARRKLGVRSTVHALLLAQSHDATDSAGGASSRGVEDCCSEYLPVVEDLATTLETCTTFDETLSVLHAYVGHLGVTGTSCNLVAEPPGQLTNGARSLSASWPEDMKRLYHAMGEQADPTVPYAVYNTESVLVDNERLLRAVRDQLPVPAATFGQALLDNRMRFSLHQPGRDSLTNAPLVNVFVIDPNRVGDFGRNAGGARDALQIMSRSFWDSVQRRRLLHHIAGLTRRQVEALTFAARGFAVPETAEHMGVSQRAVEKILAAARKRLGARTTASALYRAMVFRALS